MHFRLVILELLRMFFFLNIYNTVLSIQQILSLSMKNLIVNSVRPKFLTLTETPTQTSGLSNFWFILI